METRDNLIELYNIYKGLLTTNEQQYFEYYYFEDYSLTEIAEISNVSKSYVSKIINKIENKILKYEQILLIQQRNKELTKIIQDIKDDKLKNKIEEIIEK